MRPQRVTDLPMHRHGGKSNGSGGPSQKLQNAFAAGMGAIGLSATKTGPGDKERAWIVRQNSVLKYFIFFLFFSLACGASALFMFYEVKVARKETITLATKDHKDFHKAKVDLMNTNLALQQALESEVHEQERVEEFKAYVERTVGDHIIQVEQLAMKSHMAPEYMSILKSLHENLRVHEVSKITGLIHQFRKVSAKAKASLPKVADDIVSDVDDEANKEREYKQMMEEMNAADNYVNEDNRDMSDDEDEKEMELISGELENFFRILNTHKIPKVSQETVNQWQAFIIETHDALDNDEKEVDMNGIIKKIDEFLLSNGVSDIRKYNPDKHNSPLDYFEMVLEEAKIYPFQQQLNDLYNGWKEDPHHINAYTVLAGVERIAHDNGLYLMLEWLSGQDPTDEDADDDGYHEKEAPKAAGEDIPADHKEALAKEAEHKEEPAAAVVDEVPVTAEHKEE